MPVTRRRFLESASLAVLAGAAAPRVFSQSAQIDSAAFFDGISAETFKPFVGDEFSIALNGRELGSLTLIAVTEPQPVASASAASGKSAAPAADKFTLTFQGSGALLPQETYTLSQLSLGSFPLFLVPTSPRSSPPRYAATFNLLKP